MTLKQLLQKWNLFLDIENQLQIKIIESQNLDEEILRKKHELESLKTEVIELKDFITSKFKEEINDYDYVVNITNCYIIGFGGKKYIAIKECTNTRSDWGNLAGGRYNVDSYEYYDPLNLDKNGKCKYLCEYLIGYFDRKEFGFDRRCGKKPDYEIHILEAYPELSFFVDNKVPNTYLKKIYYEVNDLGSKQMIKKLSE